MSLGIAEAHGGALALVPSERGARFALTLPIAAMPSVSVAGDSGETLMASRPF